MSRDATSAITIPTEANNALPALTQIGQARNLSAIEAARGYPVRIRGVMTFTDPQNSVQFAQDSSGGIFIDPKRKKFDAFPDALQLVEITESFQRPGGFRPGH